MIRIFIISLLTPVAALAQAADVASSAAVPAQASPLTSFLPLVLIFVVFYFLLIKPQQKRLKEHQATLAALKKGDDVVTGGGIIGKITKVSESDTLTIEIAKGIEVSVLKSTVSGLVSAMKPPTVDKKSAAGSKNDNAVPSRDSVANDN